MHLKPKIAVIGAGLTGLTAAYYLKKQGHNVTVLEKGNKPGGVIQTHTENGFIYESGPNTGVLGNPEAVELLEELHPLCEIEVADQTAKARWIWKGNRWEPLPSGLFSAVSTPLFTISDKLSILAEPFKPKGINPEETLSQLVMRRMGTSFLHYAIDPFILGIYAGDPAHLVPKYALPKLYNLEQNYGSFIKGSIKKAREPKTEKEKKATKEIFSVKYGLHHLIDALVTKIDPVNIILECEQLKVISNGENQYSVSTGKESLSHFTHVISTVGAHALSSIIPFANPDDLNQIAKLKYARVVQVSLGFNEWKGQSLKAFGGLVPFVERRDILGALFISSFLKERAPEGGALMAVFMGGMRRPEIAELSDVQIVSIIEREIKSMMLLKEFKPDLLKIHRYEYAIPQYGPESRARLEAIGKIEGEYPGLILAGNIRDGIGMADRIKQGRTVAEQISGLLFA